jgi:predicted RNase H-like nuclease (RuvC/YqgF family)
MEKYYFQRIRELHGEIEVKDKEFRKLKMQAFEIKGEVESQRKRAEELRKLQRKSDKMQAKAKSNSPVNSMKGNKKSSENN